MSSFTRESELLPVVAGYVYRQGFRWQDTEVPFYEYRIDLYGFSRLDSLSVAVELKLRNWRRALEQSLIYQLCADRVYTALPRHVVTDPVKEAFHQYGIGLIGVHESGRCGRLVDSKQSLDVRRWYRDHFVSHVYELM